MKNQNRTIANFRKILENGICINGKIDFSNLPLCGETGDNREYKIVTGTISVDLLKGGGLVGNPLKE